jgi:ubiquinone/menaquinone biosynthesis C-methylase UbiE
MFSERKLLQHKPQAAIERSRWEYELFKEEAKSPVDSWVTFRTLYRTWQTSECGSYLDHLPTFKSQNVIEVISELVKQKAGQGKVRVVDVGYGRGYALIDLVYEFGDEIELIGYGDSSYARKELNVNIKGLPFVRPPTSEKLSDFKVQLVEGDALDIRRVLGDNSVDVVISTFTLNNIFYPKWELIKKMYRVVKPGGYAFLHGICPQTEQNDLGQYLSAAGYCFEFTKEENDNWGNWKTAFKKTTTDINVPVWSVGHLYDEVVATRTAR